MSAEPPTPRTAGPRTAGPEKVVVVGHGMVGHRLVEALLARPGTASDGTAAGRDITVLSQEPHRAYDRVALSATFDGAGAESLRLPQLDESRIDLRLGVSAASVDRAARAVLTSDGERISYDQLVLATGSYPFVPPVPGHDAAGCFVYRTLDDLAAINEAARSALATAPHRPAGVVIGGGLLGLEAANALRLLGLAPHIVEMAPHLMAVQLDEGGGALLGGLVAGLGVTVHCGTGTARVLTSASAAGGPAPARDGAGRVTGVELADGTVLPASVVVFATGVRPRDQLARDMGLDIGPRGGVLVNEACQSVSDPRVWAVGEVACVDGAVYGLVAPGYAMAETVADRLAGGAAVFPGADMSTKLKLLGVDVASFGDAHGRTPGALSVVLNDPVRRAYAKLVVSDDAATLLGGILVGDAGRYPMLRALVGSPARRGRGRAVDRALRALRRLPRRVVRDHPRRWHPHVQRAGHPVRPGPRLRHLQACRRLDPRLAAHRRPHPGRRARRAAGHQRQAPGQHAAQRNLLGGSADPGRGDHPGEADGHRSGRRGLRAVHQDHRRAADRLARRAAGAAAADLEAAHRRRL